jgi:hypothetical protein
VLEFVTVLYSPGRTQQVCVVKDAAGTLLVLKVVDWLAAAGSMQPEELALLHERVSSGANCNDIRGCIGQ